MTNEVRLAGPVDYESDDGPNTHDGALQLQLAPDGTFTVMEVSGPTSGSSHGTVTSELLATLRADIDAVDLATTPKTFECTQFDCPSSGQAFETLSISSNGQTFDFAVDRDIPDSELPSALVRLLDDLATVSTQVHK